MGIPDGDKDFPQHLQFAAAYQDAISSGKFLPVWVSADNYGFGSTGVRFYPPIPSFSLGLIQILTGNWFDAIWVSFLFWMFTGCLGIYFLAREWLKPKHSIIAALLYVIVPYHLLQIYQMWLYAEFVASAVLPFCFLFITRICRQGRLANVLLFSASYSLFLLSHIPTTVTGSISLAIYALLLINWNKYKKTFVQLIAALAISLSATAFYWVKIITEFDWTKATDPQYSTGLYDPQKNLFPLFISVGESYTARALWHFDFTIILTTFLFLSPIIYLGTQIAKFERRVRKSIYALSALGLAALFMMSLPSFFLWKSVPILPKIQFPWRWLSILSIVSVLIFAFAVSLLSSHGKIVKKILIYSTTLLILSLILFDVTQNIFQSSPIPRAEFEARLPELLNQSACDCWLTTWAKTEAFKQNEKVFADSRRSDVTLWQPTEREFTVEAGKPTAVRVATFYYPYWRAQVNNQPVSIEMNKDGSILIPVGDEKSFVKLYFREPFFLRFALVLSLITWVLVVTAIIAVHQNRKYNLLDYQ